MSICPQCGQDHHAVHVCVGQVAGKHPKGVEAMRAKALKRWADWRHARAVTAQTSEGIGEFRPKRGYRKAKPEPKASWRW